MNNNNNNKSPIFTINPPQHFSDYGFDSQFDYFQVLEEARKHKRDTTRSAIDNLHFKLQKPISKDDTSSKKIKKTRKRSWWWKNALHYLKRKCTISSSDNNNIINNNNNGLSSVVAGPVYLAESRSGSATPYHRSSTSRPSSGPLLDIPYISLRELNMMDQSCNISPSPMPIYLVT